MCGRVDIETKKKELCVGCGVNVVAKVVVMVVVIVSLTRDIA